MLFLSLYHFLMRYCIDTFPFHIMGLPFVEYITYENGNTNDKDDCLKTIQKTHHSCLNSKL